MLEDEFSQGALRAATIFERALDFDIYAQCTSITSLLKGADLQLRRPLMCIAANFYLAQRINAQAIFYSRDHNFYAENRPILPEWMTCRTVAEAVEFGECRGFWINRIEPPSAQGARRSTLSATAKFVSEVLANVQDCNIFQDRACVLIFRNRVTKRPLARADLNRISKKRMAQVESDLKAYNEFASKFSVGIAPSCRFVEVAAGTVCGVPLVQLNHTALRRIFSGNVQHGGRLYGACHQRLNVEARGYLTIDGECTIEIDFQAIQYRLLTVLCGHVDPIDGRIRNAECDPFARIAPDRSTAKLAFNIMINAENPRAARRAIAGHLAQKDCGSARSKSTAARKIMGAIERRFSDIAVCWYRDLGIRLQTIDSWICMDVLKSMMAQGILVLPVHDSFIVAKVHQHALESAMECALAKALVQISESRNTSKNMGLGIISKLLF